MTKLDMALEYAKEKHKNQKRKFSGKPYILHPMRVANMLEFDDEKITAVLHDTIEDTDATIQEITFYFGKEIADNLEILTHNKEDLYIDYIIKIKEAAKNGNNIPMKIKMADIIDNLSDHATDKQKKKYFEALQILGEIF